MDEQDEQNQGKDSSDTIYSVAADAPESVARVLLHETSVVERKNMQEKSRLTKLRTSTSKTVLASIENLDAILGTASYASGIVFYECCKQGKWIESIFFGIGFVVTLILKHRVAPGPIVQMIGTPTSQIKRKIINLTKTNIEE